MSKKGKFLFCEESYQVRETICGTAQWTCKRTFFLLLQAIQWFSESLLLFSLLKPKTKKAFSKHLLFHYEQEENETAGGKEKVTFFISKNAEMNM